MLLPRALHLPMSFGTNVLPRRFGVDGNGSYRRQWTCPSCGTEWPERPGFPANENGCPECGTFDPGDE